MLTFLLLQAVEFFAEWSLDPDNVAFIRVQNGVYNPSIIGDKPKWYSHQLDTIHFHVWSGQTDNDKIMAQLYAACQRREDSDDEDEMDDDGEGESDLSTSSSVSSLNEFVEDMCYANKLNSKYLSKYFLVSSQSKLTMLQKNQSKTRRT